MIKRELISRYAQKRGLSREQATEAVVSLLETIAEGLMIDEEVVLSNFGVFTVIEPLEREYKLPTGGTATSKGEMRVKFRPSPNLTKYVNGDKTSIGVNRYNR